METMKVTESEERIDQNLDDFEKRLYKSWLLREGKSKPKVLIHPQIRGLPGDLSQPGDMQKVLPGFTSSHDKVDSHRWIECMKSFSNEFRQIKELRETQNNVDYRLGPVVVALIDDGKFSRSHWFPELKNPLTDDENSQALISIIST